MSNADSVEYYMLDAEHDEDTMMLSMLQAVGGVSWESGRSFPETVAAPLRVDVVDGYEDDTEPLSYDSSVPMMSNDLLACLRTHGVDNIVSYPLVIRNKKTGEEIEGYSAINIIGLVSAADPGETVYSPDNSSRLIDADIDRLAIDSTRTHGFLLFRLAECVTGVVVHRTIKAAVEAAGTFQDISFVEPSEWMG